MNYEDEIKGLKLRIEKLEAIINFPNLKIDSRLNAILKAEQAIFDIYEVDVSYFSNINPVKHRKRGHGINAHQRAFSALLKLIRDVGVAYNFLDIYYNTGSFKKIKDFEEYLSHPTNEKERARYESVKKIMNE